MFLSPFPNPASPGEQKDNTFSDGGMVFCEPSSSVAPSGDSMDVSSTSSSVLGPKEQAGVSRTG